MHLLIIKLIDSLLSLVHFLDLALKLLLVALDLAEAFVEILFFLMKTVLLAIQFVSALRILLLNLFLVLNRLFFRLEQDFLRFGFRILLGSIDNILRGCPGFLKLFLALAFIDEVSNKSAREQADQRDYNR